jgi:hypothetical protein
MTFFLKMKPAIFATVLAALLLNSAESFSTPSSYRNIQSTANAASRSSDRGVFSLYMASDDDSNLDGAQITSARKELRFDDKTGRFFETNLETEECIPDEEFCTIDEETGNRIRLTIAEKERIFLDALQVRSLRTEVVFAVVLVSVAAAVTIGGSGVVEWRVSMLLIVLHLTYNSSSLTSSSFIFCSRFKTVVLCYWKTITFR